MDFESTVSKVKDLLTFREASLLVPPNVRF